MRGVLSISSVLGLVLALVWHGPAERELSGDRQVVYAESEERLTGFFALAADASRVADCDATVQVNPNSDFFGVPGAQGFEAGSRWRTLGNLLERAEDIPHRAVSALYPARGPPSERA